MTTEGPADGQVAVDGDQQYDPDGHRLGEGRQRPDVWFDVREVVDQLRQPVGAVVDRLEGLDEGAGNEVEGVNDRQRLEEPIRRVGLLIPVAAQHPDRQGVPGQADYAEHPNNVDVDDDPKAAVRTGAPFGTRRDVGRGEEAMR